MFRGFLGGLACKGLSGEYLKVVKEGRCRQIGVRKNLVQEYLIFKAFDIFLFSTRVFCYSLLLFSLVLAVWSVEVEWDTFCNQNAWTQILTTTSKRILDTPPEQNSGVFFDVIFEVVGNLDRICRHFFIAIMKRR